MKNTLFLLSFVCFGLLAIPNAKAQQQAENGALSAQVWGCNKKYVSVQLDYWDDMYKSMLDQSSNFPPFDEGTYTIIGYMGLEYTLPLPRVPRAGDNCGVAMIDISNLPTYNSPWGTTAYTLLITCNGYTVSLEFHKPYEPKPGEWVLY